MGGQKTKNKKREKKSMVLLLIYFQFPFYGSPTSSFIPLELFERPQYPEDSRGVSSPGSQSVTSGEAFTPISPEQSRFLPFYSSGTSPQGIQEMPTSSVVQDAEEDNLWGATCGSPTRMSSGQTSPFPQISSNPTLPTLFESKAEDKSVHQDETSDKST